MKQKGQQDVKLRMISLGPALRSQHAPGLLVLLVILLILDGCFGDISIARCRAMLKVALQRRIAFGKLRVPAFDNARIDGVCGRRGCKLTEPAMLKMTPKNQSWRQCARLSIDT